MYCAEPTTCKAHVYRLGARRMPFTLLRNKVFHTGTTTRDISWFDFSRMGLFCVCCVPYNVELILTSSSGNLRCPSESLRRIMRRTICTSPTHLESWERNKYLLLAYWYLIIYVEFQFQLWPVEHVWRYKSAFTFLGFYDALIVLSSHFSSELAFQSRMGDIQTRPFSKNYRSATLHDGLPMDVDADIFLLCTVDL